MSQKQSLSFFKTMFTRSPAKQGDAYIFTIPKKMIDHGIINPNSFYEVWIKEFDDSK